MCLVPVQENTKCKTTLEKHKYGQIQEMTTVLLVQHKKEDLNIIEATSFRKLSQALLDITYMSKVLFLLISNMK